MIYDYCDDGSNKYVNEIGYDDRGLMYANEVILTGWLILGNRYKLNTIVLICILLVESKKNQI